MAVYAIDGIINFPAIGRFDRQCIDFLIIEWRAIEFGVIQINHEARCYRRTTRYGESAIRCRGSAKCCRIGPKHSRDTCVRRELRPQSLTSMPVWGLMAVLRATVHSSRNVHQDVFHADQQQDCGLRRQTVARQICYEFLRCRIAAPTSVETTLGCNLVTVLLHQLVEFGSALVDRAP